MNYFHYRQEQEAFYNKHIASVTAYEVMNSFSVPGHPSFARHQYIPPGTLSLSRRGIFAFHGVGVGKTRFAIRAAESLFAKKLIDRVIILTKERIIPEWTNEMLHGGTCGAAPFYASHADRLAGNTAKIHIKRSVGCGGNHEIPPVTIMGYTAFCNGMCGESNEALALATLPRTLLVIDEGHKTVGDTEIHHSLSGLIAKVQTFLVILTATPSFNDPYTIACILNYLLLNDRKTLLSTKDDFLVSLFGDFFSKYTSMTVTDICDQARQIEESILCGRVSASYFLSVCNWYISYVHKCNSIVPITYIGGKSTYTSLGDNIVLLDLLPGGYQAEAYAKLVADLNTNITSVSNSIHAKCICVFTYPDLTYGCEGTTRHITVSRNSKGHPGLSLSKKSTLKPEDLTCPAKLRVMSVKFDYALREINRVMNGDTPVQSDKYFPYISKRTHKKVFAYAEQIRGVIDIFAVVLLANGFSMYPNVSGKTGCFAIVCADTSICKPEEATAIIKAVNSKDSPINILLGTEVLREGVPLWDIDVVLKWYSWWNVPDGKQVDGRYIRQNCRTRGDPNDHIQIHQLTARGTADELIHAFSNIKNGICEVIQDLAMNASMDYYLNYNYNQREITGKDTVHIKDPVLQYEKVNPLPHCEEQELFRRVFETLRDHIRVTGVYTEKLATITRLVLESIQRDKFSPSVMINRENTFSVSQVVPLFMDIITDVVSRNTGALIFDHLHRRSVLFTDSAGFLGMRPVDTDSAVCLTNNCMTFYIPNYPHRMTQYQVSSGDTPQQKKHTAPPKYKKRCTRDTQQSLGTTVFGLKRLNRGYMAFYETDLDTGDTIFKLVTPAHQKKARKHVTDINRNTVNTGRNIAFYRIPEIVQFHIEITGGEPTYHNKAELVRAVISAYDDVSEVIEF